MDMLNWAIEATMRIDEVHDAVWRLRQYPTLLERIEKNDPTLKELAGFGGYSHRRIAASLGKNQTTTSLKLSSCLPNDGDDGCIQLSKRSLQGDHV